MIHKYFLGNKNERMLIRLFFAVHSYSMQSFNININILSHPNKTHESRVASIDRTETKWNNTVVCLFFT